MSSKYLIVKVTDCDRCKGTRKSVSMLSERCEQCRGRGKKEITICDVEDLHRFYIKLLSGINMDDVIKELKILED